MHSAALVLAINARGGTTCVKNLRQHLARYIQVHLQDPVGMHGTFQENIVNEGFTANVHQYIDELRSGRNANGDVRRAVRWRVRTGGFCASL